MKKFLSLILTLVLAATMIVCLPAVASAGFNPDSPGDEDLAAVMGAYYPRAFSAANFKDGVIALMEGNEIGYFVGGKPEMIWRHETDPECDFLFCVNDYYPNAEYALCGFIGNDVLSFKDDISMEVEFDNVYTYDFGEDYLFFFRIRGGSLYLWTPYFEQLISEHNATDVITTGVYAFYADDRGNHVFGASLADICKKTQDFLGYHPIPVIDLDGDIWDYYPELYWYDEDGFVDNTANFNQEHGIDFASWGNPKHNLTVDDFVHYVRANINVVTADFDVPFSGYYDPLIYPDIDFYSFDGYVEFELASDIKMNKLTWFSHEGSPDMAMQIGDIITNSGGAYVRTDLLDYDGAELVYEYDGQLFHVGYMMGDPTTYVYVFNPDTVDE